MKVRPAHSEEFAEFHRICDNDLPHPLSLKQRLEQRRQEFARIAEGKSVAFFAEIDGLVEGSVQLRLAERDQTEGRVHALIVQREKRREGLGTKLMEAVEAEAQERGYRRLWLTVHSDNEPAIRFYKAISYTRVGGADLPQGDGTIEMEKTI